MKRFISKLLQPNTNPPPEPSKTKGEHLICTFCKKSQYEVQNLIAGDDANICNECVALCNELLREAQAKAAEPSQAAPADAQPAGSDTPEQRA